MKPASLVLLGIVVAALGVTIGVAAFSDAVFGTCGVACTRLYGIPIAVASGVLAALGVAGGVALVARGMREGLTRTAR